MWLQKPKELLEDACLTNEPQSPNWKDFALRAPVFFCVPLQMENFCTELAMFLFHQALRSWVQKDLMNKTNSMQTRQTSLNKRANLQREAANKSVVPPLAPAKQKATSIKLTGWIEDGNSTNTNTQTQKHWLDLQIQKIWFDATACQFLLHTHTHTFSRFESSI